MAGVNTAILATDYNTIQSNVNNILGIGSTLAGIFSKFK